MSGTPQNCAPVTFPGLSTIYVCPCPDNNEAYCDKLPSDANLFIPLNIEKGTQHSLYFENKDMGVANLFKLMIESVKPPVARHSGPGQPSRSL